MLNKFILLLVITIILVAPISYWLHSWWGFKILDIFSIEKIKYIYSQDLFLLITTLINLSLYIFAIYKIFSMKNINKKNTNNVDNIDQKLKYDSNENTPPLIKTNTNSNIDWNNLYGEKSVSENTKQEISIPEQNTQKEVNNNVNIEIKSQVPEQANINNTLNEEHKENKENNDNIVNITKPLTANDIFRNQISKVLDEYGYKFLGPHTIDKYDIDFVAIADSDTLVMGIINSENNDIIANETATSPNEPPSWFTNEKKYISPVWEIKNATNIVMKMINEVLPQDNGIIIKPVVVIPMANISNLVEIESKWKEIGVDVVKFMNNSPLPELSEILINKKDTEVLESYQNFTITLMKYFDQKAPKNTMKKTG